MLENGHLNALKRMTPTGFAWRTATCPSRKCTPLQQVVLGVCGDADKYDSFLEVASWLIEQGADPTSAGCSSFELKAWKEGSDPETTSIKFNLGCSAIALALRLQQQMRDTTDYKKWQTQIAFLSKLVDILSAAPPDTQLNRICLSATVVDRWEAALHDQLSHDIAIETADGDCGAHAALLGNASPVLKALLGSAMLEGQQKRIRVPDTSANAVSLFLELTYTGGSQREIGATTGLAALELAHRWQVHDVVAMLESDLKSYLTEESFEQIAGAAQLMQLQHLRAACIAFAATSSAINAKAAAGSLPRAVLDMLGCSATKSTEYGTKKRRML